MPRRRYRLFMVLAVVIVFLLYRVAQNSWEHVPYTAIRTSPKPPASNGATTPKDQPGGVVNSNKPIEQQKPVVAPKPETPKQQSQIDQDKKTIEKKPAKVEIPVLKDHDNVSQPPAKQDQSDGGSSSRPIKRPTTTDNSEKPIHETKPSKQALGKEPDYKDETAWRKMKEHYPISPESLKKLPAGKPKAIPKIQFDFKPESEAAKKKRLARLDKVKEELTRSWSGYRKFAWMKDELSPVSGSFRNTFGGWAATLVDSLDTLWIAGMKKEFNEAAKAVGKIDFTWTERATVSVFETTIRYLGGLLAAYDISGGHKGDHKILLDKAVELAEVLMGIFDTPNRMPILYYDWKPDFASQSHHAHTAGIAELATLSMEFTRLAQLTGEHKYYDAVDRITDGLIGLQAAGTLIPGLFPESLDISGCNRTATRVQHSSMSEAAQKQLKSSETESSPPDGYTSSGGSTSNHQRPNHDDDKLQRRATIPATEKKLANSDSSVPSIPHVREHKAPLKADGNTADWDCVPQGITATGYSHQSFHMGGGQDSAYEYFPKEYLLLGGLEPKYKKLYEDTVNAVNEWLLFRPMLDDSSWDILFPAKVQTNGDPAKDLIAQYEIAHLTCFIGGMYGLGGKIFGREKDVEIAKKLTDGCVWAYQTTASGIMPESADIMACPTLDKCKLNQTAWYEKLDSSKDWRDTRVAEWELKWGKTAAKSKATIKTYKEAESDSTVEPVRAVFKDQIYKRSTGTTAGAASDDSAEDPSAFNVVSQEIPERPQSHEEYVKEYLADNPQLPRGFTDIHSKLYILRPEAIESVWYMYRITGDESWMEKGWKMFEATVAATRTEYANSAISDVFQKNPRKKDEMESFWIAETLKYYYLLFSEPSVISLDEWVFNTEAHPFRRPS